MAYKVIYSALVGGYDEVRQPEVISEEFEYVLFCNDIIEQQVGGVWQIRKIDYTNPIQTKIARYVKTHPEELLPEYKCSVWVDQNILIKSDLLYRRVDELLAQDVLVSSMYHIGNQCVYDEMFNVLSFQYEHEDVILNWGHRLLKEEYPSNHGMFETNVLFRQHLNKPVQKLDNLWWNCIDKYSRRDQLSFNYSLWKCSIPTHYLLGEHKNVRNVPDFELRKHSGTVDKNVLPLGKWESWMMRVFWKDNSQREKVKALYHRAYASPFPHLYAFVMGQYYRIKAILNR